MISGNLQKYVSTNRSPLQYKTLPAHSSNNMMVYCLLNVIQKQDEWRLCLQKSLERYFECLIFLTGNLKFRNSSTCSEGPMKRAGKVCGDSQDLKSPGCLRYFFRFISVPYGSNIIPWNWLCSSGISSFLAW